MNTPPQSQLRSQTSQRGFALIATISIMILLVMIALAMLTLSTIELRSSQNGRAMAEAQANARLALMLAIGELQKEMGPDMRISAEAAIHDSQPETEATEGISQPHWLATYDAWGGWLNGKYTPHGKESASVSKINDTYVPKRAPMFRRWLVSLPEAFRSDIDAAQSALSSSESVVLVGQGSLGKDYALANPTEVTRAALIEVDENGRHAWWIGPENHRAKVTLAKQTRNMPALNWENSAGNTAETGISSLSGLSSVDNHPDQAARLISQPSLELVDDIAKVDVRNKFFDLTAHSQGLLTSVRTGQLKKDLSLLFEKNNSELPAPYHFNVGRDLQEPSIRPMSPDLLAENPVIAGRHFQSWTNMRHFYRMYRSDSDATVKGYGGVKSSRGGGTGGTGHLHWAGNDVYTDVVTSCNVTAWDLYDRWTGSNSYWRTPVLAKLTYIFSTFTVPNPNNGSYQCMLTHTPVVTLWNPYNVSLRIPRRT